MADLRAMGAANPLSGRSRRPATRAFFARAARDLRGTLLRPRRADQGDILVHLDVGLGAGRLAAEATETGTAEVSLAKILEQKTRADRLFGKSLLQGTVLIAEHGLDGVADRPMPATMTSDSTAMMRPYSIAVAPLLSAKNRRISCMTSVPCSPCTVAPTC